MIFEKNVTEFSTMLHRDIYMRALRLVPPEISLAEIEKETPEMAESGREFYHFMLELYSDMFCNPEIYGMTPGAYEDMAQHRKWNYMRLRVKNVDDYFCLSETQIASYVRFIHEMALFCHISEGCCYLTYDVFEKAKDLKRVTPVNKQKLLLPIQMVMKNLERVGLELQDDGEKIQVICEKYPDMFLAASALRKTVEDTIQNPVSKKLKYYFGEYMDTLDFRLLKEPYYPDFEDHIRHLSDKDREAVITLDALAKEYKCKSDYKNCLEYKYKGKYVMSVWTHGLYHEPTRQHDTWRRYVRCRVAGTVNSSYLEQVEIEGDDFKQYFMRHLNRCSGCTPAHLNSQNAIKKIFGRSVRFCSINIATEIAGLTINDLPYIRKFIEMRIREIEGEKNYA
ncbi:MAG: hypothetical protein IJW40_10555 [Clostridia bacterium]|nr:hypothetical protein [Clostridia bacterium]